MPEENNNEAIQFNVDEKKDNEIKSEASKQVPESITPEVTVSADSAPAAEKSEPFKKFPRRDNRTFKPGGQGDDSKESLRHARYRKKICRFCLDKNVKLNYRDAVVLGNYITERGKILPRRITGTCSKHQRELSKAIKRARILAILPFTVK